LDGLVEPVLHWLEARAPYVGGAGSLDWVIRDPVLACLVPALYVLDRQGLLHLSEGARQAAVQLYYGNKARWVLRAHRLKQVLGELHQAGISIIPLKGAILHSQLYHDSGLRSMSDIDILVRPEAFLNSVSLLLQCGLKFHPVIGFEDLAGLEGLSPAYWPGELIFTDGQDLVLELHQNLVTTPWFIPAYPLDISAVWERSLSLLGECPELEAAGDGLWTALLSPYDMLCHLCLHLALHGLQAIQTYLDVDLWIRALPPSWDWDQFIELVDQWQIRSAAYHSFTFCREFMGTHLPEGLLERLDPGWLARWRVSLLVSPASLLAARPTLGKRYPTLVKLALIDRLPCLLWILLKLAFPDKAWREQHPHQRNLFSHWAHVLDILKLGG
jgi:hypothetical protein